MTAPARKLNGDAGSPLSPTARPSPLAAFTARCEARAKLWQAGELDLHEAADALQAAAIRDELVAEPGQDEVQRLMAEAFAAVRDDFFEAFGQVAEIPDDEKDPLLEGLKLCADTKHHLLEWERRKAKTAAADLEMVPDALPEADGRGAADSTVEAVMYALREYGSDALHRGNTRARLAELSDRQIEAVIARLVRMSSKSFTVSERLLLALAELLP